MKGEKGMSMGVNNNNSIENLKEGVDFVWDKGRRIDAKQVDLKYKDIIRKVEADAFQKVEKADLFWYVMWKMMKKELKEKHGIDWRSVRELNPGMIFD